MNASVYWVTVIFAVILGILTFFRLMLVLADPEPPVFWALARNAALFSGIVIHLGGVHAGWWEP